MMQIAETFRHLFAVTVAHAVSPCAGLVGCNPSGNQLVPAARDIAAMLVSFGAGLSVVFVVLGGAMMLLSGGNESNASKGKNMVIFALVGYAIVLASQPLISFIYTNALDLETAEVANAPFVFMRYVVSITLSLMNVAFVIIMIYAGFRMVLGGGQSAEFEAGKKAVKWAIVGAIVINLGYVLVQATRNLGF